MEIEFLYILNCPWCVKTKRLVRESLKELGVKAHIKEILIDSDEKAKEYNFVGSPTIKIDGKDIQKKIRKDRCLPCETLVEHTKESTEFVKRECICGCRIYFYKDKQYPYPPKELIKEAIEKVSCKI